MIKQNVFLHPLNDTACRTVSAHIELPGYLLQARFSEVLERVRNGQEFIVTYGKKREKVAMLIPYSRYMGKGERKLGLLKDRARCVIHEDFKLTDEEMLIG